MDIFKVLYLWLCILMLMVVLMDTLLLIIAKELQLVGLRRAN